jgi:hypothetical protein
MPQFPNTTNADGIWTLKRVRREVLGDSWPNADPVVSISRSVTTADEGDTVTFTINTQYISDATMLYYDMTGSGITADDFTDSTISDSFAITNGSASISKTISQDNTTEGTETLTFNVRSESTSGTILESTTVTINDTSINIPFTTNSLVAHLDSADSNSYPGSGSNWFDISGNNNDASITQGSPTYTSQAGGSWNFSLGSNDRIAIPATSDFDISQGNFSIETWMRLSTAGDTTNTYYNFWQTGDTEASGGDTYLRQWRSGLGAGAYFNRINGSTALGYSNRESISGEGWYQIVITENNGTMNIYLNTVLEESISTPSYPSSGANWFTIGDGLSSSFDGDFSILRFYQKPLTTSEIQDNFDYNRSRHGI